MRDVLSLHPFALRKDLERSNFKETGKLKKRDKIGRKKMTPNWLFTLSCVIHSSSPTWPADNPFQEGGAIPLSDILLWIENAQSSTVSSLTVWEIAVPNGNRRPAMAGMVNRVSYLLLKQIVSQSQEEKETRQKKERICQIRHEHKSHYSCE